jgi:hypothetical protein
VTRRRWKSARLNVGERGLGARVASIHKADSFEEWLRSLEDMPK